MLTQSTYNEMLTSSTCLPIFEWMTESSGAYHHGDLRAALLDEAAAMIVEGGVASVTMRELGSRLGVSRFYHLKERLQAVDAANPGSGVERLRRVGEEYVRFAIENPAQYRLMYGREALARRDRPELREAANAIFEQLVVVFQAHQRTGGLKRQDPRVQAYVAWSAVHGLASLWNEGQIMATDDVGRLIDQTTRTLLDGMRARGKRKA
jgi:AcrR family transcriptional regulator